MGNAQNIAMVVSDLDGTLILPGDRVTKKLIQTCARLANEGILFTLATGRSWSGTKEIAGKLNIRLPVAVQSGAIIVDPSNEEIIASYPISPVVSDTLWQLKSDTCDCFLLDLAGVYNTERVQHPEGIRLMKFLDKQSRRVPGGWIPPANGAVKFLSVGNRLDVLEMGRQIRSIYPDGRQILWPGLKKGAAWYLEVFAPEATKAKAVTFIARQYGIAMERVMAFGDGENDRELIETAGWGCAVKEAPQDIRRRARLVVPGPRRDGVAKILERLVLRNKEERGWKRLCSIFTPTRF